jgi:hypothetical protein
VWLVAAAILVGTVVLPGCGNDDDTGTNTDRTSTTASSSTTAAPSTTAATTSTTAGPKVQDEYTISYSSYGPLHLGMTEAAAQATGLLQPPGPGCGLSGDPTEKSFQLVAPLQGTVVAAQGKVTVLYARTRYVTSPGGLHDGDTLAKAQAVAWGDGYVGTLDKNGEATFGTWSVSVKHGEDAAFEVLIDPATQKVIAAAAPYVPVCD